MKKETTGLKEVEQLEIIENVPREIKSEEKPKQRVNVTKALQSFKNTLDTIVNEGLVTEEQKKIMLDIYIAAVQQHINKMYKL